jgi:hypothetical protein
MASPLQYPGSKPDGTTKETVMNIKAIIASLVLGSSSIAMASPSVTLSATAQGAYSTTVVRDHRIDGAGPRARPVVDQVYYRDRSPGDWTRPAYRPVQLASGMHFSDGRTFINVGPQAGRFNTLQISADGGRTLIKQVYVQFDNGQEQIVRDLDRTLIGNQSLTLDLDGNHRAIRRIVVYGNPLSSGWNTRWRGAGTFSVTAS